MLLVQGRPYRMLASPHTGATLSRTAEGIQATMQKATCLSPVKSTWGKVWDMFCVKTKESQLRAW